MKRRPNHASAIVKVEVGSFVALVTGDADAASWRRFLKGKPEAVKSLVLPAPIPRGSLGAKRPTIAEIFDAVGAEYHVVSLLAPSLRIRTLSLSPLEVLGDCGHSARVMCTQVNRDCLGSVSPEPTPWDGLADTARRGLGDGKGALRCAGSISVDIDDSTVAVSPDVPAHARVIGNARKEALEARTGSPRLRGDVWQIDPARDSARGRAAAGDILVVELEKASSSAYLWSVKASNLNSLRVLPTPGSLIAE